MRANMDISCDSLEGEEGAGGAHPGRCGVAENPADVDAMLLGSGAFHQFDADPFPLELDGVHGCVAS